MIEDASKKVSCLARTCERSEARVRRDSGTEKRLVGPGFAIVPADVREREEFVWRRGWRC